MDSKHIRNLKQNVTFMSHFVLNFLYVWKPYLCSV